jgi:hypothetical protein
VSLTLLEFNIVPGFDEDKQACMMDAKIMWRLVKVLKATRHDEYWHDVVANVKVRSFFVQPVGSIEFRRVLLGVPAYDRMMVIAGKVPEFVFLSPIEEHDYTGSGDPIMVGKLIFIWEEDVEATP